MRGRKNYEMVKYHHKKLHHKRHLPEPIRGSMLGVVSVEKNCGLNVC